MGNGVGSGLLRENAPGWAMECQFLHTPELNSGTEGRNAGFEQTLRRSGTGGSSQGGAIQAIRFYE